MAAKNSEAHGLVIVNGRCLLPGGGPVAAELRCENGVIAEIGRRVERKGAEVFDASGGLVLPGIVDIHGDAFERQIMPRPKTRIPLEVAFLDTDRQLCANGITTAYHGITVSWEPGLRSLASAQEMIAALDALEPRLDVDHRLHIRWETFAHDEMDAVMALFERKKPPLLSFNDHTTPSMSGQRPDIKIRGSAERALVDVESYKALIEKTWQRNEKVPAVMELVASAAAAWHIPMLSHDDRTAVDRSFHRGIGAFIAEFPMTQEALAEAHRAADPVVLGAPNVLRGGSHNGAIDAASAVKSGQCTILASDYYYPAPLHAAFKLAGGEVGLDTSWPLVSRNPAIAAGLGDRGELIAGLRADIVVVADRRVAMTAVAGRMVLQA